MKYFNLRTIRKEKIGLVIIFTLIINYLSLTSCDIVDNFDKALAQSPWTENILLGGNAGSMIFVLYVFIIGGLMASDIFVDDKKTNLNNILLGKISYGQYVKKALVYNFIIAGIFSIIPALVNILLWLCIRPNVPLTYFNTMNIFNHYLFAGVFMKSIILFYLLHFIKIFIIGGLIASFAMYLNTKFANKYLGLVLVLVIDLLFEVLENLFPMSYVDTNLFWIIYDMRKPSTLTLIIGLIFLVLPLLYFNNYAKKSDVL